MLQLLDKTSHCILVPDNAEIRLQIKLKDNWLDMIRLSNTPLDDNGNDVILDAKILTATFKVDSLNPKPSHTYKCNCPIQSDLHLKECPFYAPSPHEIYRQTLLHSPVTISTRDNIDQNPNCPIFHA